MESAGLKFTVNSLVRSGKSSLIRGPKKLEESNGGSHTDICQRTFLTPNWKHHMKNWIPIRSQS